MKSTPGKLLAPLLALTVVAATSGCAAANSSEEHARGASVADVSAAGGPGPSATARMVCSDEIKDDVAAALALPSPPHAVATWADPTYSCDYHLSSGTFVLTVQQSPDDAAARRYFDQQRASTPGAMTLTGLPALNLPAFETADGVVVFTKDNMTLLSDASGLPDPISPGGLGRADFAYQIATDVIACWKGD